MARKIDYQSMEKVKNVGDYWNSSILDVENVRTFPLPNSNGDYVAEISGSIKTQSKQLSMTFNFKLRCPSASNGNSESTNKIIPAIDNKVVDPTSTPRCIVTDDQRELLNIHSDESTSSEKDSELIINHNIRKQIVVKQDVNKSLIKQNTEKNEKSFRCNICSKLLLSKASFNQHLRFHDAENPFKCNYCNKLCSSGANLIQHMRCHTGEKPFECEYCNKFFASKSNLKQHMRSHTGEKPFKCNYCNKVFASSSNLNRHIANHDGKKKFKCLHCNKLLSSKASLNQHTRIHTGEKPFKCNYCIKAFSAKSTLVSHLKKHKEKKTFECKDCNKLFSWRSSLERHMKTHVSEHSSKKRSIYAISRKSSQLTREL